MATITHGAILQNDVKAWPPLIQIGAGLDLVTQAQWFLDVATPTTKATAVPVSGEAGLDAKFTEVIKCVTDAVNEGWKQRYTYADEPRIKSGAHISALIWVATTAGGSGITAKLVNSTATETAGVSVATDGDWTLLFIEDHTCAGTYVELQVTKDAAGTFYAGGPITVSLGLNAIALPSRQLRYRSAEPAEVVDLTGDADSAYADLDLTGVTSPLAAMAELNVFVQEATNSVQLYFRRNGSSTGEVNAARVAHATVTTPGILIHFNRIQIILDDAQICEYALNVSGGTADAGSIGIVGYWEWE